jgi:hypothetical protein
MKKLIIWEVECCYDCPFIEQKSHCHHPEIDYEKWSEWSCCCVDLDEIFPGCPLPKVEENPDIIP